MISEQAMDHYESIANASSDMVSAARAGDWESLAESQQRCARLVEDLRNNPESATQPAQQKRRIHLIRTILANDAAVRELTEPWLAELRHMLQGFRVKREVGRHYR